MKIAPLREKLIIQEKRIVQDNIGNESAIWTNLLTRWCSCRPLTETETDGRTTKLVYQKVQFTLRYDKALLELTILRTRIVFRDKFYEIETIDGDTVSKVLIYIVATKEKTYD